MSEYEVTSSVRRVNRVMMWMARRGLGPASVLTTTGRRSGEPRSVPVSSITVDGIEYVVSAYGSVAWVANVRADPMVTLGRREVRTCRLVEVTGSAPDVVHAYWAREKFARKYMGMPEGATVDDFRAHGARFPTFRVEAV
jgi:deazaflavin-dependent oxidoreductase (nitroreductase family)